jgi:peptidyl-prolyl cis-trans isomerase B (cyclophilin B)
MARGDDPASATTSFFICIGECRSLDGKYTAFARVVSGMETLDAIAAVPVDGETPKEALAVTRARVMTQAPRAVPHQDPYQERGTRSARSARR